MHVQSLIVCNINKTWSADADAALADVSAALQNLSIAETSLFPQPSQEQQAFAASMISSAFMQCTMLTGVEARYLAKSIRDDTVEASMRLVDIAAALLPGLPPTLQPIMLASRNGKPAAAQPLEKSPALIAAANLCVILASAADPARASCMRPVYGVLARLLLGEKMVIGQLDYVLEHDFACKPADRVLSGSLLANGPRFLLRIQLALPAAAVVLGTVLTTQPMGDTVGDAKPVSAAQAALEAWSRTLVCVDTRLASWIHCSTAQTAMWAATAFSCNAARPAQPFRLGAIRNCAGGWGSMGAMASLQQWVAECPSQKVYRPAFFNLSQTLLVCTTRLRVCHVQFMLDPLLMAARLPLPC